MELPDVYFFWTWCGHTAHEPLLAADGHACATAGEGVLESVAEGSGRTVCGELSPLSQTTTPSQRQRCAPACARRPSSALFVCRPFVGLESLGENALINHFP